MGHGKSDLYVEFIQDFLSDKEFEYWNGHCLNLILCVFIEIAVGCT